MDASSFLLVLAATVFVSLVLLAAVCLDCWNKGALVSIRQTTNSDEYMQSTAFRVILPQQSANDLNSMRSPSHLLSPPRLSSSVDPGTQRRHRSFTPTETGSNPSYENPPDGPEYVNPDPNLPDSDVEDPGYITVIPDGEALAPSNQSRASTPSSDVQHDYVNLDDEERDYLNVDPQRSAKATPESSAQSNTDDDDDDDYEGNYVNQPPPAQIMMGR
ncbi:linker for activation of T-cells family member 1-like isoform X2 [Toxotes jaculatrix]|uniref:linker for activation of T-cells family member 1-like isoform X2 n=1 Tax=Toxotes jaculatrix TaxID=941984 RepID=UPI001B3B1595|nr:linker for activation of T-cells family member 1-like isoform X2 [Toxotes jaculatrix]